MPQQETDAKRKIRLRLARLPNIILKSNPQIGLGVSGVCDMDGCWEGLYVGIEVKTPTAFAARDHGLSEVQVEYGLRVLKAGGCWRVADGPERAFERMMAFHASPQEYCTAVIAMLETIKDHNREKWSAKHIKNVIDRRNKRRKLRPIVQQRLIAEAEQAASDLQIEKRYERRFRKGKTPIPWEVLMYGLNHDKLEP